MNDRVNQILFRVLKIVV